MALSLAKKRSIVAEVSDVAGRAVSAVAAAYRGLTVAEITELRKQARAANVYIRVIPNTLAKRALAPSTFACMHGVLQGPLLLAFAMQEASAAARVLRDFAKKNTQLEIKALAINSQLLDASKIDVVASLPTYEEAVARLLAVFKAPMVRLVRTLVAPSEQLVRTMVAICDQKAKSN